MKNLVIYRFRRSRDSEIRFQGWRVNGGRLAQIGTNGVVVEHALNPPAFRYQYRPFSLSVHSRISPSFAR